ncbi:hypothetical protein FNV43_RR21316 [Rhamnella rubrinervis]|uniref:Uncharacterized protein n=1 Tax=Rhamnella rubrinervis TaxID=2594499 RepID=A0A8K0GVA3_9ROSA|nr:hypothetical protein FNV43_RR21316 [Rhamnella rubrinervis]
MEKRKRVEKEEEEECERLKTKTMKEGDKEQAVPTEEEVEEFYAIVRRMQEAMKYFERGNNGGDQARRSVEGRWRAVMETEKETKEVEDEDEGLKKKAAGEERVVVVVENNNNGVDLDLNAEPVEIESST